MSLQAFTIERMKTSNGLGFGVSMQTNRTFYMFFEVFIKATSRQKHIRLSFAILRKLDVNQHFIESVLFNSAESRSFGVS